jgi:hypothetical protein
MNYPRALLAGYTVVVAMALLVAGSTSATAFGAYNPAWDGASDLRSAAEDADAEPRVVRNVSEYEDVPAESSVAVVLSPDRAYEDRAAGRLRQFLEDGGTIVVAEDYGPHGNALLASLNASARVDGQPLRDERHHYRSPALPVATNVSGEPADAGVEELTLNHGTAVKPNGATVLARSSGFAYRDENDNEQLDENETLASYPVVTIEEVGDGRVIVASDPSMLINAMLERDGNRRFVGWLFTGQRHVLLDYSHTERLPPVAAARLAVQRSAPLQMLAGLVGVLAVAGWARGAVTRSSLERLRLRIRPRPEPGDGVDQQALVAFLKSEHPDWEEARIQRIVERRLRSDSGDNLE